MGEQRLTEVTRGPAARLATILGLLAAGFAIVMTVAMVVIAIGGYSSAALQLAIVLWILSLATVFTVTRYLKLLIERQEEAAAAQALPAEKDHKPGSGSRSDSSS